MPLNTREGEPFLTVNGVQTQSALVYNLLNDVESLREAGVGILRVSPQSRGTFDVLESLRDALAGGAQPRQEQGYCNGFWHGRPGLERAA